MTTKKQSEMEKWIDEQTAYKFDPTKITAMTCAQMHIFEKSRVEAGALKLLEVAEASYANQKLRQPERSESYLLGAWDLMNELRRWCDGAK